MIMVLKTHITEQLLLRQDGVHLPHDLAHCATHNAQAASSTAQSAAPPPGTAEGPSSAGPPSCDPAASHNHHHCTAAAAVSLLRVKIIVRVETGSTQRGPRKVAILTTLQ